MALAVTMNHLVITRFNTGNKDPEWLEHRMRFFRAFTAPSLKNQTNTDFTSVFLVDPTTPEAIVEEVRDVGVVYKTDLGQKLSTRNKEFRNFLATQTPNQGCVITSRVDSDDSLARNWIERTNGCVDFNKKYRTHSHRHNHEFIVYTYGVVWTNGKFFRKTYLFPPFLAMAEWRLPTAGRLRTVFCIKTHDRVAPDHPYQAHNGTPMWLMVCHDKNMLNEPVDLDEEISLEEVQKHFDIDVSQL